MYINSIRDTVKEVAAMTTVAWAVQEKVFVIFNSSLAEAHRTGALKIMSKSMFAKVAKFYS